MSKVAHGGANVSQTGAEMRLFSGDLHVVTSGSWYNFVQTCHIGWTNGKLCSKLHIIMDLCVKRCVQTHLFLTANMSHSAFAESKTMETFRPDMSTYVKSCTRTRPRKSKWCRVISWSVVVVSRSSWSSWAVFFVVSRSSWMVFIFYGGYAHVFTEPYGWGKPWTNVRGWVEHV